MHTRALALSALVAAGVSSVLTLAVTLLVLPPVIRAAPDGGSEELHATQAEMQAALERVRDDAEAWFDLTEEERDDIRDEYAGREFGATRKKILHH